MATTTSYFKFTKVDEESGFSVLLYPSNKPIFPDLPDLNVFFGEGNWFYGTANSSAKENKLNNIIKMTKAQILEDFRGRLPGMKQESLVRLSDEYQNILNGIKRQYDEEDSPIGLIRYQDAKAYVENGTISTALQAEVDFSGVDIDTLSSNIISGYEEYIGKINSLTALKTKISNRINTFTLKDSSFIEDFNSWYSNVEEIGNTTDNPNLNNLGDMDLKIEEGIATLRYYSPNLKTRWEVL